jgi:hypothetical protein
VQSSGKLQRRDVKTNVHENSLTGSEVINAGETHTRTG